MCGRLEKWDFGSNNRGRWSENGEGKGSGSDRVASTKECEGCVEVFGVDKLLQMVCQRFCEDNKAVV